jgi:hypothetical protein
MNTHSGMLFSSNTETVVQNSSTTTCCALLHSTVLTRDWLLQNFQQNCFHDTYLYFQKYCVWTSFHWIQFRRSLRSLVVPGSAVRMQLPCGLVCLHNMKMFLNTEDHSKSIRAYWIYHKRTHDTELYVFFWIILLNNTVSEIVWHWWHGTTGEGWCTRPVPAPLCLLPPSPTLDW